MVRRWAAAAAAVAVAAAAVAAGASIAASRTPERPAAPLPSYYLYGSVYGNSATVRASATNKVLATLIAPSADAYTAFSAAADDRTFAFAEIGAKAVTRFWVRFLLLRLSANGSPAALTRLRYTFTTNDNQSFLSGAALSPDARTLAVATTDTYNGATPRRKTSRITLVSVTTGKVLRSWVAPSSITPTGLSWVRGTSISFTSTDARSSPAVAELRLLPVASPSGELLQLSKVVPVSVPRGSALSSASISPDGSTIFAWAHVQVFGFLTTAAALGQYTRSGKLIGELYGEPASRTMLSAVWPVSMDPSGQHLLIQARNTRGTIFFGRLDNGRLTPLVSTGGSDQTEQLGSW